MHWHYFLVWLVFLILQVIGVDYIANCILIKITLVLIILLQFLDVLWPSKARKDNVNRLCSRSPRTHTNTERHPALIDETRGSMTRGMSSNSCFQRGGHLLKEQVEICFPVGQMSRSKNWCMYNVGSNCENTEGGGGDGKRRHHLQKKDRHGSVNWVVKYTTVTMDNLLIIVTVNLTYELRHDILYKK